MAVKWESILDEWDEKLRKAFLSSVYAMRSGAQIELIATMLEKGDIDGAIRAVGLDPNQFRQFDKAIEGTFEAGGDATAGALPAVKDAKGFKTVFNFSIRNPGAENWLRSHSSTLIREILDDQRTMIRGHLVSGMEQGNNPRTVALDLVGRITASGKREGGVIGLTDSQAKWVRNYEAELASDTPSDALSRALRDKRFDASVLRAEAKGEPIPADLRAKMSATYRNRALRYRAEAIARTEAISALHQSQREALNQATSTGKIDPRHVRMTWRSAHDKRVRHAHRQLDGQTIPMGGTFHSELGPIRFPGDPDAAPANTIQCRCVLEPHVDFLAGVH